MAQKVDDVINEYDERIEASSNVEERKALRSERKYPKQVRKQLKDLIIRKQKYQRDFKIFGKRNSYSKTDPDATFMRMKDDYMKNGQLKPGYNVQIATEGQYALAYSLFSNPTDTLTLIPFLNEIEQHYFNLPKYIVADAGYGSEQNYDDILTNRKREPLITYNMYLKEQKKKYKQNNSIHITGCTTKKVIHIFVRIRSMSSLNIDPYVLIKQVLNESLKFMNVKTAQDAHFALMYKSKGGE